MKEILHANSTIYNSQFGFREKHSTQQAITSLVEKITESYDTGDMVISGFLDLKKVFDSVSHDNIIFCWDNLLYIII